MKRMMAAIGVAVVIAGAAVSAKGGPTMDETKAWLESEGRELLRANRLQTDLSRFAVIAGTDTVETLTLDNCTLYWRTAVQSQVTVRSQAGPTTTRTYDVVVFLRDLGSVQVTPDTLLTDAPVYKVQFAIRNPFEGSSSTSSVNNGNPALIRSTGLPVQTPEDGQRIANAVTHAAALCGVALGGRVF